jgi:hypothetical protein
LGGKSDNPENDMVDRARALGSSGGRSADGEDPNEDDKGDEG